MSRFKRLSRTGGKLRLALTGQSFSGKSFTALQIAAHLGTPGAPAPTVAVIDTEDKARIYADQFDLAILVLTDYSPQAYINAIREAEQEFGVLVIDGLSDAWTEVKRIVAAETNTQRGWGKATPQQEDLQQTIRRSPLHIIATMRALEDEKGRLQIIQRDTMLYEFAELGELEANHVLTFRKTYVPALRGKTFKQPGAQVAGIYREWLGAVADRKRAFAERMIGLYGHLGFGDMTGVKRLLDLAEETYDPDREETIAAAIALAVEDWQALQARENGHAR